MAEKEPETFIVTSEDSIPHNIGDGQCDSCWSRYPKPCACGGLIHAQFGDESDDGYWLHTKCDRCGECE